MSSKAKKGAAQPEIERPRPVSWPFFLIATVLLCAGAGVLLYPAFLTIDELRNIGSAATNGPVSAVAMIFIAIALYVIGLNRQGPSEPPFALDLEVKSLWRRLFELVTLRFFYETWRELDREAEIERAERAARGETGYDWKPLVVLTTGAVFLTITEYLGHKDMPPNGVMSYYDLLRDADTRPLFARRAIAPRSLWEVLHNSPFVDLMGFAWWAGWRVLGFFLLPALVIKLVLREKLTSYGLATAGFMKHAWIYAVMLGVVLIAVVVVSYDEHFKSYYPFYRSNERHAGGADRSWYEFWTWEILYAAQFFSLEFFFRGYWLKGAKRAMGSHAIYAMVVPYCLIHFGKPFLETLGAILAGIALGTLALRTRSIWSGFLIHVSVAITMDLAALLQTVGLPDRWWPEL